MWPWTSTSKSNRVHPHNGQNMFANNDEDADKRLSLYHVDKVISIYMYMYITWNLDLWPSKSIGFILSS